MTRSILSYLSVDFSSGVTDSYRSPSVVERHRESSWGEIAILRHDFIFIVSPGPHYMPCDGTEQRASWEGCWWLQSQSCRESENWDAKDRRRENSIRNHNSFPRPFTRLIVFCWSNFGSYENNRFVLKKNDVPHGADGNFVESRKKIKEKLCSSALITSCRLLCRFNQMADSILQACLYINEQQSVIFDLGKWNVHHL